MADQSFKARESENNVIWGPGIALDSWATQQQEESYDGVSAHSLLQNRNSSIPASRSCCSATQTSKAMSGPPRHATRVRDLTNWLQEAKHLYDNSPEKSRAIVLPGVDSL
ncbi:MAG: hypothetical protein U0941_13710 [Planctomycetaceae bacterium]